MASASSASTGVSTDGQAADTPPPPKERKRPGQIRISNRVQVVPEPVGEPSAISPSNSETEKKSPTRPAISRSRTSGSLVESYKASSKLEHRNSKSSRSLASAIPTPRSTCSINERWSNNSRNSREGPDGEPTVRKALSDEGRYEGRFRNSGPRSSSSINFRQRMSGSSSQWAVPRRSSLRSMHSSTRHSLPDTLRANIGFLPELRRRAGPRCRALVRMKSFQFTMLLALLMALFLPDLWIIFDRPDNADLDIILTGVMVLFLGELSLQSIGLTRTYWGSWFFWMDLLGAASLVLDLTYLGIPLTSSNTGDVSNNVVIMRMARVAKLGARAGRFTKLVKLLRFLPGLSEKGANIGTAKLISAKLTTMLSMRVSCLIILMVMIMPLFSLWSFPEQDWSTRAWMEILEGFRAVEDNQFNDQLNLFIAFYADKGYYPYLIRAKSGATLSSVASASLPWTSPDSERGAPARSLNIVQFETTSLECLFNFKQPTQIQSLMTVLLMVFIMMLMVGFSLLLSNSVSAIVLQPLERLLLQVRTMAATIFQSVSSLASPEMASERNSEDEADDEIDHLNVFGSEAKILEKVLKKLVIFSDLTKPGLDAATMAGMGEGDKDMLTGYVGGDLNDDSDDDEWGEKHPATSTSDRIWKLALANAQTVMIESAGLSAELLNSWNINPLELDSARNRAAITFFLGSPVHGIRFDAVIMAQFLDAAEAGYIKTIPYHNWYHAVDVTHGVYRLMGLCGAEHYLPDLERYALLVSATCHDIGHPGLNNVFLVEASHELALRYNDKSPLENMHCARLFELLGDPHCNIFGNLSEKEFQDARKICIEAILHTDNVHHFAMVKEVQMMYEVTSETSDAARKLYQKDNKSFPTKDITELFRQPDTRKLLTKLLLHTSDISNCVKPFRICSIWATKVLEEFFAQGDAERKAGIPVQALNDRDKVNRPNSQVGFIEFLAAPLFFAVAKVLPPLLPCAKQMVDNTQTWSQTWARETKPEPGESERASMEERVKKMNTRYNECLPG